MSILITKLTLTDAAAVDELMKNNSRTLGFLPRKALESFLRGDGRERVLGARTDDHSLVGYMIYAAYSDRFRIAHLCVSAESRQHGIARRFIEELKLNATTQNDIRLHCRRDYPAHKMWPKLGFVPLGEKPGRSAAGHILTFWRCPLAEDNQLELFRAHASDETLDVGIDAQILFDFFESDNDTTIPSKALLSDFLTDSLNVLITDEMYVEINRKDDPNQRQLSRQRAQGFPTAQHDLTMAPHVAGALRTVLPHKTPSQQSDIQQLAKATAAGLKIFVTRDASLLKRSAAISGLTGLQLMRPTDVVVRLHELSDGQSYAPRRIAGSDLAWRRVTSSDLLGLPLAAFRTDNEKQHWLRKKLSFFPADPDHYSTEVLWFEGHAVGIRILAQHPTGIAVPFCRIARTVDRFLFSRFLVADTVARAVDCEANFVAFDKPGIPHDLVAHLSAMGFVASGSKFLRYCFSRCFDRDEALSRMTAFSPESKMELQNLSSRQLEDRCSPCSIKEADQNYFLVPIRPTYAMSLFDVNRSANDLFGGKTTVLLRWENVYYRVKSQHRMLRSPARILWYVSQGVHKVVAVSRLTDVEIGTPKDLFKRFKKFGILEWSDLYKMCGGDPTREVMALVFSHTFLFRESVPLETLRAICHEDRLGLVLQAPQRVPAATFRKIFGRGFPTAT